MREAAADRLQPSGVRFADRGNLGLRGARKVPDQVRPPVAATHDADLGAVHIRCIPQELPSGFRRDRSIDHTWERVLERGPLIAHLLMASIITNTKTESGFIPENRHGKRIRSRDQKGGHRCVPVVLDLEDRTCPRNSRMTTTSRADPGYRCGSAAHHLVDDCNKL